MIEFVIQEDMILFISLISIPLIDSTSSESETATRFIPRMTEVTEMGMSRMLSCPFHYSFIDLSSESFSMLIDTDPKPDIHTRLIRTIEPDTPEKLSRLFLEDKILKNLSPLDRYSHR